MNIHQIIVAEVNTILKEGEDAKVYAGLDKLLQAAPGGIPELEKVVAANILPYLSSLIKGPLKEVDEEPGEQRPGAAEVAKEMGAHAAKTGAVASKVAGYLMSHIPGGKKTGIMIATALDKSTEDHVRNAVLFAIGNLIAGSMGFDLPDLGTLLQEIPETAWEMLPFTDDNQEWDWGAINALDDTALLTWAWLKVKNAVDVEEKLQEFGKFIGRSDLGKQPEVAPEGPGSFATDDTSFDAKAARAAAAQEKGKEFRGIKEMKIKTSQLYKIIQEELEVVIEGRFDELKKAQKMLQTSQQFFINLAQELEVDGQLIGEFKEASIGLVEAVFKANYQRTGGKIDEIFDLDMSALLDEMMEEGLPFMKDVERSRQGKIPPAQAAKIKAASTAMQTRAGDPSRTSQGSEEEEEDLTKPTEVSEITTVSTDDLYLAEMFDTGSDTKESCAAKGGQWNEASQKCEFLEEAEDKSFSKAAKEIEKKGTEGVFTAKAKKAGMGVQAYAAKVLKKGSKASTKTKRQAAFAKGAATVARENK